MGLRKLRRRKGDYPPNPTQWDAENNGISLRGTFEIPLESPLCPFDLDVDNVHLLSTHQDIGEFVDDEHCRRLFGIYSRVWSGMTIPVDEEFVVIVNPTHSSTRRNATLMEEYFHILLEHKPSRIFVCPKTGLLRREYDTQIETDAFHSAAAALVPFRTLKLHVGNGESIGSIAERFQVSTELVKFRLKTCKLYRRTT